MSPAEPWPRTPGSWQSRGRGLSLLDLSLPCVGAGPVAGLPSVPADRASVVGGKESKDALCYPLLFRLRLGWL